MSLNDWGFPPFQRPRTPSTHEFKPSKPSFSSSEMVAPLFSSTSSVVQLSSKPSAAEYRFSKTQAGITKPLPDKTHPWSDLADALQYICLAMNSGLVQFIAKRIRPKDNRRPKPKVSSAGWT